MKKKSLSMDKDWQLSIPYSGCSNTECTRVHDSAKPRFNQKTHNRPIVRDVQRDYWIEVGRSACCEGSIDQAGQLKSLIGIKKEFTTCTIKARSELRQVQCTQ